jgi:hypothetical protein
VVVTVVEHDLELNPPEERRRWVKDEAVLAGVEAGGKLWDPAVVVGLAGADVLFASQELHPHAARRLAAAGIEDMR